MTTDPRPPLWRVMHQAHMQHADPVATCALRGYAAELRAIAEELQSHLDKYFADGDAVLLEVLNWLDVEADRAEAGE